jgi:hypothetical protein
MECTVLLGNVIITRERSPGSPLTGALSRSPVRCILGAELEVGVFMCTSGGWLDVQKLVVLIFYAVIVLVPQTRLTRENVLIFCN